MKQNKNIFLVVQRNFDKSLIPQTKPISYLKARSLIKQLVNESGRRRHGNINFAQFVIVRKDFPGVIR
jgi:hypothetical protein